MAKRKYNYTNQDLAHIYELATQGRSQSVRTRYTNVLTRAYKTIANSANAKIRAGISTSSLDSANIYLRASGRHTFAIGKRLTLNDMMSNLYYANTIYQNYNTEVYVDRINQQSLKPVLSQFNSKGEVKSFMRWIGSQELRGLIRGYASSFDAIKDLSDIYADDDMRGEVDEYIERYRQSTMGADEIYNSETLRRDIERLLGRSIG